MRRRTWARAGAGLLAAAATTSVLIAPAGAAPGELDWYLRDTNGATSGAQLVENYGNNDTYPLACDGDGTGDFPSLWDAGYFLIEPAEPFQFGRPTDVPLCGDWDGDGVDTAGVFRNGTFFAAAANATGSSAATQAFGRATDVPLVGDWNGDGIDSVGVMRGNRYVLSDVPVTTGSVARATTDVLFGKATDLALVGDWDGNGTDTLGLARSGTFFLSDTDAAGSAPRAVATTVKFGRPDDFPLAGDWYPAPDGGATVGVVRVGNS